MAGNSMNMDVDMPNYSPPLTNSTLKRSSSAPMINVLDSNMTPASSSQMSVSESTSMFTNFNLGQPRARRYSASFSPVQNTSISVKLSSRIRQIKQEEGMDVLNRELAHEKKMQSELQISQSWEDLTLTDTIMEDNCPNTNNLKRPKSITDPLHIFPCTSHFPIACSSPSPTRIGKQCFSPSMQVPVRNPSLSPSPSPSPTRKSFTTRRSLSPITLRPSQLSVKRKFDMDTDYVNSPPKKFAVTPERMLLAPHPLTHSLSSSSLESGINSPDQRVPQGSVVDLTIADSTSTSSNECHSPVSAFKPVEQQSESSCGSANCSTLV